MPPVPLIASYPAPEGQAHLLTRLTVPEFSCLTPGSRIPITGVLFLNYTPDRLCVDLRALRMYVLSFRERQLTEPSCIQEVASVLIRHLDPWWLELIGQFSAREGVIENPTATFLRPQQQEA